MLPHARRRSRLVDVPIECEVVALPAEARRFLVEAERRILDFQQSAKIPGFVPSDFERVYAVLQTISEQSLAAGPRFCEWGSGFGVVAGFAAMLGFETFGIEIELDLVEAARELADDFELPVEFVHGSFIPRGGEALFDRQTAFSWLVAESDGAYESMELDADDFDVTFCYPWPDEQHVTAEVFERYASDGAILISFHGGDDIRVRRKTLVPSRRRLH
jgi:SAM-dependent methyltransferase